MPDNALFCHICGSKQIHNEGNMEEKIELIEKKLEITDRSFSEKGRINCKQWIIEFGFEEVMEAADISLKQYLKFDTDGKPIQNSANTVFDKISGICANRKMFKEKPYLLDAGKMLGYANKKFRITNYRSQELKEHIERILYLFYKKTINYNDRAEDLFWRLKKATDEWEFLNEVKELIEIWENND